MRWQKTMLDCDGVKLAWFHYKIGPVELNVYDDKPLGVHWTIEHGDCRPLLQGNAPTVAKAQATVRKQAAHLFRRLAERVAP